MVHDDGPAGLDAVEVVFDDERAVADAGMVLPATLAARLGIAALVEETVELGECPGAANPGHKVMTLVAAMALGADSIDDCDILRAGRTAALLGHRVAAPSTIGTFLRAFTFGHVRQLDRVLGESIERAWRAGAGPGDGRLIVDVDSFVGEVHGYQKQGACFGYTRERGYHPLLASRADTGEVLHVRLRKGSANTARGALRFVEELIARTARAGATGAKLLRADSGFWSNKIFARLEKAGWSYSIGVRLQSHVCARAAIEAIPEDAWQTLADYPPPSVAQIAETTLGGRRLVVRRVRTLDAQGELLPSWEHYPFVTNREQPLEIVEAEHRPTCEGEDVSPPLAWSGAPEGTRSLALVVDDPGAPARTYTHWLAWALDPGAQGLREGEAAPVEGRNYFGTSGYRGPCPPPGHGRHRYFFRLYALDFDPDLGPGAGKGELERLLEGHTVAAAELACWGPTCCTPRRAMRWWASRSGTRRRRAIATAARTSRPGAGRRWAPS